MGESVTWHNLFVFVFVGSIICRAQMHQMFQHITGLTYGMDIHETQPHQSVWAVSGLIPLTPRQHRDVPFSELTRLRPHQEVKPSRQRQHQDIPYSQTLKTKTFNLQNWNEVRCSQTRPQTETFKTKTTWYIPASNYATQETDGIRNKDPCI